jgi:hypothetical protein
MVQQAFDFEKFAIRDVKLTQEIKEGTYPINQATVISVSALEDIKDLLRSKLLDNTVWGAEPISEKSLRGLMDEIGTEWTTKQGNWPKRFAKVFKYRRSQKFDNDFLSRVGKIARESCIMSTGKELVVSKDFDWSPGDYGDYDSCFWRCRSGAKKILRDARAFALLIHGEDENPLGRAWCVPYKSYYVVFNAYARGGESITIVTFARIVSDIFNFPYYRNVRLTCRGMTEGPLWINNGKGYVVGPQEVADLDDVNLEHALYCSSCDEECCYEAHLEDDRVFCENCYSGSNVCECCDRRIHDDDTYWVHDTAICGNCADNDAERCYECENLEWNDNITYYRDEAYCERCVDRKFVTCDKCKELVHQKDTFSLRDGYCYCDDCVDEHTFICKECGYRFSNLEDHEEGMCWTCYRKQHPEATSQLAV